MDNSFFKGLIKGIEIKEKFNRKDKLNEAHQLACQHQYERALEILENLQLSSSEKTVANLTGYLLKAICYAELKYDQSAQNSIRVILEMSRISINPFYVYSLPDIKQEARNIATEYGYNLKLL